MDAQRFDPTKKVGLSPLLIPQAPEVGPSPGDQQVVPQKHEIGANNEERQYAFLLVPPPTPRAVRRQKSYDAERFRHSKQKPSVASAVTSPTVDFPTSGAAGFVTKEPTLLDSVAFKLPSPSTEDEFYSTDSDRSHSAYETSSFEVGTPSDDHVNRRIIRPQRSRLGLRKSFANLRKARSSANLPKLPCTATFGVPTPVSSNDSLPSSSSTSTGSGRSVDSDKPLPSRRPSMATLSSPVALNEVTDTLRRLASRLNLRDAGTERKWNFDEVVDYYERTWARAESGDGAIEVCVAQTKETFADPRPQSRSVRPDGIGLYARPRSRKNTMPAVAERPHQEVPV